MANVLRSVNCEPVQSPLLCCTAGLQRADLHAHNDAADQGGTGAVPGTPCTHSHAVQCEPCGPRYNCHLSRLDLASCMRMRRAACHGTPGLAGGLSATSGWDSVPPWRVVHRDADLCSGLGLDFTPLGHRLGRARRLLASDRGATHVPDSAHFSLHFSLALSIHPL